MSPFFEGEPVQVSWQAEGLRKRRCFAAIAKAEGWAQVRNDELKKYGIGTAAVPEPVRVKAMEAMKMVELYGRDLLDAVRLACSIWEAEGRSIAAEDAVARLINHRIARRKDGVRGGSERYTGDLRLRLRPFSEAFKGRKMASIQRAEISEWIDGLPGGR